MQELAQATFTYEQFPEVMSMLWKRMLQENKRNWRRTYKVRCVFHCLRLVRVTAFFSNVWRSMARDGVTWNFKNDDA